MDVPDRQLDPERLLPVQGAPGERHDLVVEGLSDFVLLRTHAVQRAVPPVVGRQEHGGEVEPLRLPVLDRRLDLQQVDPAHHLVERAESEFRHVFAQLLGNEAEKAHDELGRAAEARAQDRVLGRHPHRARVQVALPHHDAPEAHEHRRSEPELLGPHQRRDGEVPAGLQLPVDLHADPVAKPVVDQRLLGLGQAELPRQPRVLDGSERRGARSAVAPRDQHQVGLRLGDPGRDRPDADLGDELDGDVCPRVDRFQVVDELREVLDGVDVVVRRRRDERHVRHRVPDPGDLGAHLVSGELPALAGLGPLRHLDLQLVGVYEVLGGRAEARGGDLPDPGPHAVTVRERDVPFGILAPFP